MHEALNRPVLPSISVRFYILSLLLLPFDYYITRCPIKFDLRVLYVSFARLLTHIL